MTRISSALAGLLAGSARVSLSTPYVPRKLRSQVEDAVDRHLDKLIALRAELLKYWPNGELGSTEWNDEVERFMHSQLAESLTAAEARSVERHRDEIACLVALRVARAAARPVWYQS
jgi:hypothetical protein